MASRQVPSAPSIVSNSRYELLVKVATGGTATVFVGRERGGVDGRWLAIKRMHPYLADDASSRAQLRREASIAASLRHPNLIAIHDLEEADGELLLVMDYVEGGSLAELLAAGALEIGVVLRILCDACAGLAALHRRSEGQGDAADLVHRDVSPQNILVGRDGVARLGDFGLAKAVEVSSTQTVTARGKVAYMAPEQIEGQPATRRSDVFAMGVVAWEALAGKRLFRGHSEADTMRRVLSHEPDTLSSLCPTLPKALSDVIARTLAKDPEQRQGGAAEVLEQLIAASRDVTATREQLAAAVDGAMAAKLTKRRAALVAMTNLEATVTGALDVEAMLEARRSSLERAVEPSFDSIEDIVPTKTLTLGEAPPLVETLPLGEVVAVRPPAPTIPLDEGAWPESEPPAANDEAVTESEAPLRPAATMAEFPAASPSWRRWVNVTLMAVIAGGLFAIVALAEDNVRSLRATSYAAALPTGVLVTTPSTVAAPVASAQPRANAKPVARRVPSARRPAPRTRPVPKRRAKASTPKVPDNPYRSKGR